MVFPTDLVPLIRQVGSLFAAKEVEASEPGLRSNLLNWVDLQAAGRPVDPAVLLAIERQAAMQLQKINVTDAIDHQPLVKSGYALLAIVVLFCVYLASSPKRIGPSLWRVFPLVDAAPATRTEILSVTPGDTQVLAGQTWKFVWNSAARSRSRFACGSARPTRSIVMNRS